MKYLANVVSILLQYLYLYKTARKFYFFKEVKSEKERGWILDHKLYWYPKFYKHALFNRNSSLGTFIKF